MNSAMSYRLPSYALFAALLAFAGLPIYINAPKFYVDEYGVSLAALGAILFGLRLLDVVQDPLLGRLSEALRHHRATAVAFACFVMAVAMFGLFAIEPIGSPLIWFGAMLILVFSAYSFLTICFYAQGVSKAAELPGRGHLYLARWRETGSLLGVCVASVVPVVLAMWMEQPFVGFVIGFAVLCFGAAWSMRHEWQSGEIQHNAGFGPVLADPLARRLLLIALINNAPIAVSATLFLFFVESALDAPAFSGPLLLLFFLSAAVASPFWSKLAERFGVKPVLISAMLMTIVGFIGTLFLGPGDAWIFAIVCLVSGVAIGADMTLLPALFAQRLAKIAPAASEGFGLWAFATKFTLAFAAAIVLPLLESAGLEGGDAPPPEEAVQMLRLLYAGLPCALKLVSIFLLWRTELKDD